MAKAGIRDQGSEDKRRCRICDCIDEAPCIDDAGEACHWVGPDLCSACEKVGFKP